jgi:hypothetical protein
MRYLFAPVLALLLPGLVVASDTEETLRYYLTKSDVIVIGEFATEPVGKEPNEEFRYYQADFKITEIVKWDAPVEPRVGMTVKVHLLVPAGEQRPELKKGGACMLFLGCREVQPTPSFITADLWFGVQRPSPGLAKALSRSVAEQKKTPLSVPAEKDIDLFYPNPNPPDAHFKEFKIDRADLVKILRTYHVVPKYNWENEYSHLDGDDRTGTIVLRDRTRIQYMVRPGGLACLTFPDGRRLFLARDK